MPRKATPKLFDQDASDIFWSLRLRLALVGFGITNVLVHNFTNRMGAEAKSFLINPFTTFVSLWFGCLYIMLKLSHRRKEQIGFIFEAIFVAATVGVFVEAAHIQALFGRVEHTLDIEGEWEYSVSDLNGSTTHCGVATVTRDKDGFSIFGFRLYVRDQKTGNNKQILSGGIPWQSKTVWVCAAGGKRDIHFVYDIKLPPEPGSAPEKSIAQDIHGYCVVTPNSGKTIEMLSGTYAHLSPGTLNGKITFTRKSTPHGQQLPTGVGDSNHGAKNKG